MARALLSTLLTASLMCGAAAPGLAALAHFETGTGVILAQPDPGAVAVATAASSGTSVEAPAMRRLPVSPGPSISAAARHRRHPPLATTLARKPHRSYYPRRRDTGARRRGADGGDIPH